MKLKVFSNGSILPLLILLAAAAQFFLSCEGLEESPASVAGSDEWNGSGSYAAAEGMGKEGRGGGAFFPLQPGNRWGYCGEWVLVIDEESRTDRTGEAMVVAQEREIMGLEEVFGRNYVVEEERTCFGNSDSARVYWKRYRQDRAGLYEADVPLTIPPCIQGSPFGGLLRSGMETDGWSILWEKTALSIEDEDVKPYQAAWNRLSVKRKAVKRAISAFRDERAVQRVPDGQVQAGPPGGVMEDELTRLKYPLRPGQKWTIRNDPLFTSTVESHQTLDLEPGRISGFRIRLGSELYGSNDSVLFWYGRSGFLGHTIHLEEEATDINGNVIGTILSDETLFLESLSLNRPGRWNRSD